MIVISLRVTKIIMMGYMGLMEQKIKIIIVYWGITKRMMDNAMETTIVCMCYMELMENSMETLWL